MMPRIRATTRSCLHSLSLTLLLGASGAAAGVSPLFESAFLTFPTGTGTRFLEMADLDADGREDLVVLSSSATVSFLLGHGDGTFGARTDLEPGGSSRSVAIGDLDEDGDADLAVASTKVPGVTVFLGRGDGTFSAGTTLTTGEFLSSITIGDVTSDGHPDLVVGHLSSPTISVLSGAGDGTFGTPVPLQSAGIPTSLATGDLDADGRLDVIVGNRDPATVSVFRGGEGGLTFDSDSPLPATPSSVAMGDVNGDSHQDLVVATWTACPGEYCVPPSFLSVLLGNGDRTFAPRNDFQLAMSFPQRVRIADLNADGPSDLVVAGPRVLTLLGQGNGNFVPGPKTAFDAGIGYYDVATGDLDGDGRSDLVVTDLYSTMGAAMLGNGDGTFGRAKGFGTVRTMLSVATGDLNGDGKPDAVACGNVNTVSLHIGNGDGTFQPLTELATRTRPGGVVVKDPVFVATQDLTGDGRLDIVVANLGANTVAVTPGEQSGTFKRTWEFEAPGYPTSVAAGDVDRDGRTDLVVSRSSSDAVSVFFGIGNGKFLAGNDFPVQSVPVSVAIGDVDLDGDLDLVVAKRIPGGVSVLLGDGHGAFEPRFALDTGENTNEVELADFDRDGRPDLAVLNFTSHRVSVLRGRGDGTFGDRVDFETHSPIALATGDLNGDGWPDVAVLNGQSQTVSLLLGDGQGGLHRDDLDYGLLDPYPRDVAIEDLNGDGRLDLVVVGGDERGSVLLGRAESSGTGVASRAGFHSSRTSSNRARYDLLSPSSVGALLLPPYPRLEGGSIEIRYRVLVPGALVQLRVFDVRGRQIWSRIRSDLAPGEYLDVCDPRAHAGLPLSTGLYLLRLQAGPLPQDRKVLVLHR